MSKPGSTWPHSQKRTAKGPKSEDNANLTSLAPRQHRTMNMIDYARTAIVTGSPTTNEDLREAQ